MLLLRFLQRWGPLLLWMGVIFAFSSSSDPYQALPGGWEGRCAAARLGALCDEETIGRFSHLLEYAVLGGLSFRAVVWQSPAGLRSGAAALGLAAAYALLDEAHQLFVPGRTFQLFDLALDVSGAFLGGLAAWLLRLRRGR